MTIRNIITAGALSALVGIAGVVSSGSALANADDAYLDLGTVPLTVQAGNAQFDYSFEGDAAFDHGEIVEKETAVEEALLLDDEFDGFDIN